MWNKGKTQQGIKQPTVSKSMNEIRHYSCKEAISANFLKLFLDFIY